MIPERMGRCICEIFKFTNFVLDFTFEKDKSLKEMSVPNLNLALFSCAHPMQKSTL